MKITYSQYESEYLAYIEGRMRGFLRIEVEVNSLIYELDFYSKDRFYNYIQLGLNYEKYIIMIENIIVLDGLLTKKAVREVLSGLTDSLFDE